MNKKLLELEQKIQNLEGALKEALLDNNSESKAAALDIISLFLEEKDVEHLCSCVSHTLLYNIRYGKEEQIQEVENILNIFEETNETSSTTYYDDSIAQPRI